MDKGTRINESKRIVKTKRLERLSACRACYKIILPAEFEYVVSLEGRIINLCESCCESIFKNEEKSNDQKEN